MYNNFFLYLCETFLCTNVNTIQNNDMVNEMEKRFCNDKFENKNFLGEDDMEETGGQISNVGQQVDGSSDAEESQRLVSYTFYNIVNKFDNIYSHER